MAKLQWAIALYSPQQINVFRLSVISVEVCRTDSLTGGMGGGGKGGGGGGGVQNV